MEKQPYMDLGMSDRKKFINSNTKAGAYKPELVL